MSRGAQKSRATDGQNKYWCWTLFNYEELPEEKWPRAEQWDAITYLVWQKECCPTSGRMHLQGYVELSTKRRFSSVKEWLPPGAHIEARRRSALEASNYCKKREGRPYGEPYEWGTLSRGPGRNDLEEFKAAAERGLNKREALREFSEVAAKYPRFVDSYLQLCQSEKTKKIMEITPRYSWQQDILDIIKTDPDDRTLHWIYDQYGGAGKSYLVKHLKHAHDAFVATGGKGVDIAHNYQYQRIVIFDFPRSIGECVSWGVIEELKNGMMSSNKYESTTKTFDPPHVFIFANFECPSGKFSADRIKMIELGPDHEKITGTTIRTEEYQDFFY